MRRSQRRRARLLSAPVVAAGCIGTDVMRAARIVAPRQYQIVDVDAPDIGAEPTGRVVVRTQRSALCGSDMPLFAIEHPASAYPFPPGQSMHECVGVVAASRSNRFKEGDPVLSIPGRKDGLAEYFLADEAATVPLPGSADPDQMLIAQPLGTVIWACRKLGNLLHSDTVVVGQGPMGLLLAHMLSNLGARSVIVTDVLDYRLAVSRLMRATHTINVVGDDPVAAVAEITAGRMAHVVIEAVGHQTETINQCLDLVKPGGTVVAFGVPDQKIYNFRFSDFFRRNVHFIGSVGQDVQNDVPLAMDMILQGRIDVSPIITHHIPFADVQRGFELSLRKHDGAIKVIFEYD
jgi:2-desacetyl-2-hydroxyethyl bacteriochlorophyllide A dehydrogenase